MGFLVRKVIKKDFEGIMDIESNAFNDTGYSPYFVKMIPYLYPQSCLIAEIDKEISGYCLGALDGTDLKVGWILTVAVKPNFQGKGIGKTLTLSLIDTLEGLGVNVIKLTVSPHNPARKLYKELGFEDVEFEKDCYGKGEDRFYMERRRVR